MIFPPNDVLVNKLGGDPYAATVLIGKRAKELETSRKPLVEVAEEVKEKSITIACEEVYQDKVTINDYKAKSNK